MLQIFYCNFQDQRTRFSYKNHPRREQKVKLLPSVIAVGRYYNPLAQSIAITHVHRTITNTLTAIGEVMAPELHTCRLDSHHGNKTY